MGYKANPKVGERDRQGEGCIDRGSRKRLRKNRMGNGMK